MNDYNSGAKKLRRTRKGRIVAGVCSGIGDYIGVDANIIRIALAIATFFGGLGVGIYAIGWLLLPDEDKDTSIVQDLIDKQRNQSRWQDAPPADWQQRTDWQEPPVAPNRPVDQDAPVTDQHRPQA
jgi:phage shock protein PspC (stress-responsive transcriptional regulator)